MKIQKCQIRTYLKRYFSLFKIIYISVCLKNLLKTALNKKCKNYIHLNNPQNTKEQLRVE